MKTKRCKVLGIKKKKKVASEWCITEDRAQNQKELGPILSLTSCYFAQHLTFEPWVLFGISTHCFGFSEDYFPEVLLTEHLAHALCVGSGSCC